MLYKEYSFMFAFFLFFSQNQNQVYLFLCFLIFFRFAKVGLLRLCEIFGLNLKGNRVSVCYVSNC